MPASRPQKDGFLTKIKRAFYWRWNLLFLGAGTAFAFLSKQPDVILPIVAAGELLFLGTWGLEARFQRALKLGQTDDPPALPEASPVERYEQVMSFILPEDQRRYHDLRESCLRLLDLRKRMELQNTTDPSAETFRAESLEKMLWLYLRILHQKSGYERFLSGTSEADMRRDEQQAKADLAEAKQPEGAAENPLLDSIQARLETIQDRLKNHAKTTESLRLCLAEISKTEQQITHVCESGMTGGKSAELSTKIDGISQNLRMTEGLFSSVDTQGLFDEEAAPPLITSATLRPKSSLDVDVTHGAARQSGRQRP